MASPNAVTLGKASILYIAPRGADETHRPSLCHVGRAAIPVVGAFVACLIDVCGVQSAALPSVITGAHHAQAIERGHTLFRKAFSISEGLGPDFNAASCVSCHDTPTMGGSGKHRSVDWIYVDQSDALGAPGQRFTIGPDGEVNTKPTLSKSRRRPPTLFGLGYLEAIPTDTLLARSDPFDADGDGISGRLPWRDDCFGRFGWQSSVCDIQAFVTGALSRELGIELLPKSRREITESEVADLAAYVRGLLPLPSKSTRDGADLFQLTGCATCHTPVTGVIEVDGKSLEVRAYTDLLVHEIGAETRLHTQRDSRTEFRTPALWGVASTGPPYLHDGSAASIEEAILRHGGEGARSRRSFKALSRSEKQRLLAFVRSR